MKLMIFITIFSFTTLADDYSVYHQINAKLDLLDPTTNKSIVVKKGAYLKPNINKTNINKWYYEVSIVDENGIPVDEEKKLQVSQHFYNRAVAEPINRTINLKWGKREVKIKPNGYSIVLLGSPDQSSKESYPILLVDEEGKAVNHYNEIIGSKEKIKYQYKLTKEEYLKLVAQKINSIHTIVQINRDNEKSCPGIKPCLSQKEIMKKRRERRDQIRLINREYKVNPLKPIEIVVVKQQTNGCSILKKKEHTKSDVNSLNKCLSEIKKKVISFSAPDCNAKQVVEAYGDQKCYLNRKRTFHVMSNLPKREQEFLALTLTAHGEAGIITPPLSEMKLVMKTIDDRKNNVNSKKDKKVNHLDVAIHPYQYSMYNNNSRQWISALTDRPESDDVQNSVKAFIQYKDAKYSINNRKGEKPKKIFHYVTANQFKIGSGWYKEEIAKQISSLSIDGEKVGTHGRKHLVYTDVNFPTPTNDFRIFKHNPNY